MTTYSKEWHYEYCMGEVECKHGDPECPHNHFLKNKKCECQPQPNTTPIKDEIYSILRNQYDYSDDPEYTWEDLVTYKSLEEAAQTITTYIDNKIIEELESLYWACSTVNMYQNNNYDAQEVIENRIATIKSNQSKGNDNG